MKDLIINSYKFNLLYAHELVVDVPQHLMTQKPAVGLENHPAFTLGHLVSAAAMTVGYLGGSAKLDTEWERLFKRNGPGDPRLPESNPDAYPSKSQLLDALRTNHQLVEKYILILSEERFKEPLRWRFQNHMPTLGDLLQFMCITHESMHLGQLAAWRRAVGLPSALAKM